MKDPISKIQDIYWKTLPYEYRPFHLWYIFKCWAWTRTTTIKPRYLPHTYTDRVEVLPHMMFEILSQFIERECSPGNVEWYGSMPHIVEVNGKDKNVRDEMQDLYDWWHKIYNKEYGEVSEILWKEYHKLDNIKTFNWCEPKHSDISPAGLLRKDILMALNKLEHIESQDVADKMHRLVNLRQYLWT